MPSGYFLGDNGYGLTERVVTPILQPVTPEEIEFNRRHRRGKPETNLFLLY